MRYDPENMATDKQVKYATSLAKEVYGENWEQELFNLCHDVHSWYANRQCEVWKLTKNQASNLIADLLDMKNDPDYVYEKEEEPNEAEKTKENYEYTEAEGLVEKLETEKAAKKEVVTKSFFNLETARAKRNAVRKLVEERLPYPEKAQKKQRAKVDTKRRRACRVSKKRFKSLKKAYDEYVKNEVA